MNPPPFSLLETMRWTPREGFPLRSRHLDRLSSAATFFGYRFDRGQVEAVLARAVQGRTEDARVRLTLDQDGVARAEVTTLIVHPGPLRTTIYPEPVEAGGPFWRHKTTHRPHYSVPYAWAQSLGFDDALLLDPDGFVVEATRANVWVEQNGRLLTPPLSGGGLAGVYRAHVLETRPGAEEAKLSRTDLEQAQAIYLSNAVRGLIRAELCVA